MDRGSFLGVLLGVFLLAVAIGLGPNPRIFFHPASTIVVIDPAGNQGVVVQEAREASRRYLRKHRDFIVNATNVVYTTRKRWIDLAMSYGARTRVVMVDHGLDGAMAGNRSRDRRVPEDVVSDLYFKLDAPTPVECHSLVLDVG